MVGFVSANWSSDRITPRRRAVLLGLAVLLTLGVYCTQCSSSADTMRAFVCGRFRARRVLGGARASAISKRKNERLRTQLEAAEVARARR